MFVRKVQWTVSTKVKIMFFVRLGKIKIQDILACSFLDDLLEVWD